MRERWQEYAGQLYTNEKQGQVVRGGANLPEMKAKTPLRLFH